MKTTKLLLSSFILAGAFCACSNEDVLEVPQSTDALAERAQVNLTIENPVKTKFTYTGENVKFTTDDIIGSVLVDPTTIGTPENGVHVGNNKWAYNPESGKFETAGTTAVGSWVFYTNYKEELTTSRGGIVTEFPRIQEGSADWKWLANNNVNLFVSPVITLDGYEGEAMTLKIPTMSIYNYLNIRMKFEDEDVTNVEKIVLTSTNKFYSKYLVINGSLAQADIRKSELNDENGDGEYNDSDRTILIDEKFYDMQDIEYDYKKAVEDNIDWGAYTPKSHITPATGAGAVEYESLIVDCDGNHADADGSQAMALENGEFSTWMLMPAGEYTDITLTVYTNKGVFEKTIGDRNEYKTNMPTGAPAAAGVGKIYLRNNVRVNLANVEKVAGVGNYDYISMVAPAASPETIITKTSDLIDFIKNIEVASEYEINVTPQDEVGSSDNGNDPLPAHKPVINKAVMDAIAAKEAEVDGDITLTFANYKIDIIGETEGQLELKNLNFVQGATVKSGNVKVLDKVIFAASSMDVETGSSVEFNQSITSSMNQVLVEKGAIVSVTNKTNISQVENYGTFKTLASAVTSISKLRNYSATVSNAGSLTITELVNGRKKDSKKYYNSSLSNTGTLTISGGSNNNSNIANNGIINVKGNFDNQNKESEGWDVANITNGANGVIAVNGAAAVLTIKEGTTLVNKNDIHVVDNNEIHNLGTITAHKGAITLITKNSEGNERTAGTANVKMGTIVLSERAPIDFNVSDAQAQGYIQYTVSTEGTFTPTAKDAFNKVVFEKAVNFNGVKSLYNVKYIVANSNVDFETVSTATGSDFSGDKQVTLQELTFKANAAIFTNDKGLKVGNMTVNEGVRVSVPAKSKLFTRDIINTASMTTACLNLMNNSTLVVSGTADIYGKTGSGVINKAGGNVTVH